MAYSYDKVWRQVDQIWPFISGILRPKPNSGAGYLAGEAPDGITTLRGAPVSAEVRVLLRTNITGHPNDGLLIASTISAVDGTWRIEGIDPGILVDVVFRLDGYNDILMSSVHAIPY